MTEASLSSGEPDQDAILRTHLIDPALLRVDDFTGFMAARKAALLQVISAAMGKAILSPGGDEPAEDDEDGDGDD